MSTKEPNQIFEHLVIHAGQCKVVQVKNNTQVVHHFLKAHFTSFILKYSKIINYNIAIIQAKFKFNNNFVEIR